MASTERYKYKAINSKGRPVRGMISAASEVDLYNQLQSAGLELVDCNKLSTKSVGGFMGPRIQIRDLIQLFLHLKQMQDAGVPLLDSLGDIRDTTDNNTLRDVMAEIYRDINDGAALSEAMKRHPKVFNNLYVSLVKAGEDTGDLTSSYIQLIDYLKWVDEMKAKVKKATTYPVIVLCVVLVMVIVMMGYVVPQIVGFLRNMEIELPFYSVALIATSDFVTGTVVTVLGVPIVGGLMLFIVPIIIAVIVSLLRRVSHEFAYRYDLALLNMPLFGTLIRKISIARYAQTFGALFSSGIAVVGSLQSARQTVSNKALLEALEVVEEQVKNGTPLSDAFNTSGEFPNMVVRMLRIGEESGNLTEVLDQVAEFYTKDVDDTIQGMIAGIEPALTGVLGIFILWIAAGVFGPIYESFGNMDF